MKYSDIVKFNPIETIIELIKANEQDEALSLVKSYVMSDDMSVKIKMNILSQLQMENVIDNKGVLLVGNYGTGKSHLMSVVSAVASDERYLEYLQNAVFAEDAKIIAGKFEVLRIEIGAVGMSFRDIILTLVQDDFSKRGITFAFPSVSTVANNKTVLNDMMTLFQEKYPNKGYLIVVDELLDYLKTRNNQQIMLDLGFMRELGEVVKGSKLRIVMGIQEMLFENPSFSFVSETLNKVRDRFEQFLITKTDTAFVVKKRVLEKTDEQKILIREHLEKFTSYYAGMSNRIDEFVDLYPIHPEYIDVFNKLVVLSTQNRHILKNISETMRDIMENDVPGNALGIISYDSYWDHITTNMSFRANETVREVIEKSGQLESQVDRNFPQTRKMYKGLAKQIIYALSVFRLTTIDTRAHIGLTSENLRDELCLFLPDLPDNSADSLQSIIQVTLQQIITTVSGQFIEYNSDNGQYYIDLDRDVNYDEKITQRAAGLADDLLNIYFFDIVYHCMSWDVKEYRTNFRIYEYNLNWFSHSIYRRGYLFLGTPENRPTTQPPRDYYIYFLPPYGSADYIDEKKKDEVFFTLKSNEEFKNKLQLYAAALELRNIADHAGQAAYQNKADRYKKWLAEFLSNNKTTCLEVVYRGEKKQLLEVIGGRFRGEAPFKDTIDMVSSLLLDEWFNEEYPEFPKFKTRITVTNQPEMIRAGIDWFAGRKTQQATLMLDSFGLIEGESLSVSNSVYAGCYIGQIEKLQGNSVLNFSDIYDETEAGSWEDKKYKVSYGLFPIVLLALVYNGHANIMLPKGILLTASNLEILPGTPVADIMSFKYISKPTGIRLAELVKLFEVFELPIGTIQIENQREKGLIKLLGKTKETLSNAIKAKTHLQGTFDLWGEPLIPTHIAAGYKTAINHLIEVFSNFENKYNTVPKLNNFDLPMNEIESIGEEIKKMQVVLEYLEFKTRLRDDVSYLAEVERSGVPEALKAEIESGREAYRVIRDSINDGKKVSVAASEAELAISKVKKSYCDYYYSEHQKHRLSASDALKKKALLDSEELVCLKQLRKVDMLPSSKLDEIEKSLSSLLICQELTTEKLKSSPICSNCNYRLDSNDPIISGQIERLHDQIDALKDEWVKKLMETIDDPLIRDWEKYLEPDQQSVVSAFAKSKALPEKVDGFFINAIQKLLEGFDPVSIPADELIEKLSELTPSDQDTFKRKLDEIIGLYTKGKDPKKLRIIIKR